MKKLLLPVILMAWMGAISSCSDGTEYDSKKTIIQDSLNSVIPTWQALTVNIEDNKTHMNIIVGDATFYSASAEEKNRKADELGKMVMRIYGKGNYLEKGNLIVTKDVKNTSANPADGVATPIDFAGIKKTMWP